MGHAVIEHLGIGTAITHAEQAHQAGVRAGIDAAIAVVAAVKATYGPMPAAACASIDARLRELREGDVVMTIVGQARVQ